MAGDWREWLRYAARAGSCRREPLLKRKRPKILEGSNRDRKDVSSSTAFSPRSASRNCRPEIRTKSYRATLDHTAHQNPKILRLELGQLGPGGGKDGPKSPFQGRPISHSEDRDRLTTSSKNPAIQLPHRPFPSPDNNALHSHNSPQFAREEQLWLSVLIYSYRLSSIPVVCIPLLLLPLLPQTLL